MSLTDRRFFCLLGEVVDGNPTEEMMQASFTAAGLSWKYISIPVPPASFTDAFEAAKCLGFAGMHITKPYKIAASKQVDRLTPAGAKIGAVNCVYRLDGALVGDNTDGRGLVDAVAPFCRIDGSSVVVLGAGGAARAVAVELALLGLDRRSLSIGRVMRGVPSFEQSRLQAMGHVVTSLGRTGLSLRRRRTSL